MIFPSPVTIGKHPFFPCDLRRFRRVTAEVNHVLSKNLKEIEDLSADALPMTTSVREGHQHGAAKHCQIGTEAATGIMNGVVNGSSAQDFKAMIFLDLTEGCI